MCVCVPVIITIMCRLTEKALSEYLTLDVIEV